VPGTLLDVVDETQHGDGRAAAAPLAAAPARAAPTPIWARQEAVAELLARTRRSAVRCGSELTPVRDLERLAAKVATARVTPRELRALAESLARLPGVARAVAGAAAPLLRDRARRSTRSTTCARCSTARSPTTRPRCSPTAA
jgi:DNA mismatch repair protein MutS